MLAQLKRELTRRDLERTKKDRDAIRARCQSFAEFAKEMWPVLEPGTPLQWNWHLDAICDLLERVTSGQINRLLINVPPGSSKSMMVSVLWPAWEWSMGLTHLKYLNTSFNDEPVDRDCRKARDLILSEKYQALWPEVRLTRKAETSYANDNHGTREGSAFGSLTSKRADRLIIDDPHSVKTAESDEMRRETVRLFLEGALNRLNDQERSAIVIVMQRLHQGDISGTILSKKMPYVHLCLPMEFEPAKRCRVAIGGEVVFEDPRTYEGEPLDHHRFPRSVLDQMISDTTDFTWAGQYQQRPAPRGGGMFKRDKLLIVESVPAGARRVRGWDIAGSTRKTSPFTAGVLLAKVGGMIYVEDVKRERAEIEVAEQLIVDTAINDTIAVLQSLPQDPGQAGKSQKRQLSGRLGGLAFVFSTETGAKADRAIPIASQANAGNVRLVRADWNAEFLDEVCTFPASTFKDQVDALSRAYDEFTKGTDETAGGAPEESNPEMETNFDDAEFDDEYADEAYG